MSVVFDIIVTYVNLRLFEVLFIAICDGQDEKEANVSLVGNVVV